MKNYTPESLIFLYEPTESEIRISLCIVDLDPVLDQVAL